jgi:hypothetical protein
MGFKKQVRAKGLTIAQQALTLRAYYPSAECDARREVLRWAGKLQPTPMSPLYDIAVNYELGSPPKIYVLKPKLEIPKGKKLPHTYNQKKQRICLYYPNGNHPDWNRSQPISTTIIPWASEWLLHYEIWLATGEWIGGGIHMESTPKTEQN